MSLTDTQSGTGNRIRLAGGDETDVVARVSSDQGTLVVLYNPDGSFHSLESEGNLRDDPDTEHVSTTAEARAQEAEDAQRERDNPPPAERVAGPDAQSAPDADPNEVPVNAAQDANAEPATTDPTGPTGDADTAANSQVRGE